MPGNERGRNQDRFPKQEQGPRHYGLGSLSSGTVRIDSSSVSEFELVQQSNAVNREAQGMMYSTHAPPWSLPAEQCSGPHTGSQL